MQIQLENQTPGELLRLRPDLRCSLHENDGSLHYAVEDLANGGFYRIGVREWELATRLDGSTPLADVVALLQEESDGAAMTMQEAEKMARSLLSAGLVVRVGADGEMLSGDAKAPRGAKSPVKLNPFFMRFPLIHPDRQLAAATPWCQWLLSWPFFALWILVVLGGGYCIATDWQRFAETAFIYLAPHTWIYLLVVWCFLKVVHEFFHGIVCKKFGGYVGSSGVALILFSPVAYVDVTSAWRFRSKWARIFTSAAGIYCELFIAGAAAIAWTNVEPGAASHLCHSIVLMASLTTLLFNANPLMRFDGYFILSDLLEIQNLYGSGQQVVKRWLRRCFLGLPGQGPVERNPVRRWIINVYGVAAAMWRILVCCSMILLATTLFKGAGVLIALLGVVSWFGIPCFRFAKSLFVGQGSSQPNLLRFTVTSALTCSIATIVLWLPWPGGVTAPAIVAYSPEEVVRAATEGFVEQVHVDAGQEVSQGQVLLTLRNHELTTEYAQAKLAVEQSEIRLRVLLHRQDERAAYQAETEQLSALKKQRDQLQARVDDLVVRAPNDGVVLGQRMHDLTDRFIEVGVPLVKIARENRKEIHVSIAEADFDVFSQYVGTKPRVRVRGRAGAVQAGQLAKVEPRATLALKNEALSGTYGGPLAVRDGQVASGDSDAGSPQLELMAPRFHGVITLPAEEAQRLRSGQLAKVRLFHASETIGRRTFRAVQLWIQQKLNQGMLTSQAT